MSAILKEDLIHYSYDIGFWSIPNRIPGPGEWLQENYQDWFP